MLNFAPISAEQISETENIEKLFPMVMEYLDKSGPWGETYWNEDYEWFVVCDDSFETESERKTWLSIVCLTEKRFENNLHLSVFEIAAPLHSLGLGTKVMSSIIDIGLKNHYGTLTLQVRNPKLVKFYQRFGFKPEIVNGTNYFVLQL